MEINKFKVNLGGVLDVLSNHLYSSEQVFVRELLQNACDAITARSLKKEKGYAGKVHVEILGEADQPLFVIEDNGIGLTEEEVNTFLSSIGSSTKRENLEADRNTFIGQFGIGLLSCFMVSDTITVVTQSADDKAIKWVGKIDGTYEVEILEKNLEVGTKVYIPIKSSVKHLFTNSILKKLIRKYGEILPYPISFSANQNPPTIINSGEAIWQQNLGDDSQRRLRLLEYGAQSFDVPFFDYFDINIDSLGVSGVGYLIPYSVSTNIKQEQKVFLKKMLLSDKISNVLPEWCFFVKVVLNTDHLRPTASRESFYENEALETMQLELGKVVKSYLYNIVQNEPKKLQNIISIHGTAFKQMALADDEFYQLIIPHLKFSTNHGEQTIHEIKDQKIFHVSDIDEFRKLAQIATYKGVTVINSGYVYDAALLRKITVLDDNRSAELVNVSYFIESFEDIDTSQIKDYDQFFEMMNNVLNPYKCKVEVKDFDPEKLPTLYYMSTEVNQKRQMDNAIENSNELWGSVLSNMNKDVYNSDFSVLCLNAKNEMIQRLFQIENKTLFKSVFSLIYVNALMMGHHSLTSKELNIVNNNLMNLIDLSVRNED